MIYTFSKNVENVTIVTETHPYISLTPPKYTAICFIEKRV